MKFLNKLYRYCTHGVNEDRIIIYLLVNIFLSLILTVAILSSTLISALVFVIVFLFMGAFNLDAIFFDGDMITWIQDEVAAFKRFK